jgi:MFS family permease
MYLATRTPVEIATRTRAPEVCARSHRAMSTVVLLGITSLLTDLSSEMVTSTLPLMLTFQLRLTPLQLGIIDGVNRGAAALVCVAAALLADRRGRHKEVATSGYALSAASRFGLLAVSSSWAGVLGVQLADRVGKGIRVAARDAMISLSVPCSRLGWAFGVHRSFDTAGAMLGPLAAFALLAALPGSYSAVVTLSALVAVVGVSVIALFVRAPGPDGSPDCPTPETVEPAACHRRSCRPGGCVSAQQVAPHDLAGAFHALRAPRFRAVTAAAVLLSLVSLSDTFVYLTLHQRADFAIGWFPLLYVGTAAVYLATAPILGRVADGIGRGRMVLGGYLPLLAVYLLLLTDGLGAPLLGLALVLFGLHYAATDGVLAALASATLPAASRATGLAALTTATSLARFGGSVLFGALWMATTNTTAVRWYSAALVLAWLAAAALLRSGGTHHDPPPAPRLRRDRAGGSGRRVRDGVPGRP